MRRRITSKSTRLQWSLSIHGELVPGPVHVPKSDDVQVLYIKWHRMVSPQCPQVLHLWIHPSSEGNLTSMIEPMVTEGQQYSVYKQKWVSLFDIP